MGLGRVRGQRTSKDKGVVVAIYLCMVFLCIHYVSLCPVCFLVIHVSLGHLHARELE